MPGPGGAATFGACPAQDSKQLPGQLLGRLLSEPSQLIQGLLKQARNTGAGTRLLPLTNSLTPPGGPLLRTLSGHTREVQGVAVTADGRLAVSASGDQTLKVWDLVTGQQRRTLGGHTDKVTAVAVTPDGRLAVSTSWDQTLKVWDLATGRELRTLDRPRRRGPGRGGDGGRMPGRVRRRRTGR